MSHAIIMGGSIAGLCAAAALAKTFDRVTVLERDPEPGPDPRRGAPQGHHVHALLSRGQTIMHELFPGAFAALARDGAVRLDIGTGFRWFQFGSWKVNRTIGVDAWMQSRPLLEHHLRQSIKANAKVELRFGVAVDEPVHANGRVAGLRLRDGTVLEGELVVDATGRGSRSSTWLERWGYGAVQEQRVRVGLAYVSGVFESTTPATDATAARGVAVYQHAPLDNKRLGYSFPLERGRRVVTLAGYHGDHAPTEIGAFREWAKTLLQPAIADELSGLRLVGGLHKFTYPEQLRRCYGEMRRLPEGYLIIGDAMCSFDPTFGQGMLITALQAEQLAQQAAPGKSTQWLQRKLHGLTTLPFTMAANEAYRWAETSGWKPRFSALQRAFVAKVFNAGNHDQEVYQALTHVMHFLTPPTALIRPKMLWRVLTARRPPPVIGQPGAPLIGELSAQPLSQTGS